MKWLKGAFNHFAARVRSEAHLKGHQPKTTNQFQITKHRYENGILRATTRRSSHHLEDLGK